jgi:N6-adenosine-specific RNA methylase IME4
MSLVRCLLCDSAWRFNQRFATRRDNPEKKCKYGLGATNRYSAAGALNKDGLMSTDEICSIGELLTPILAPDCYCFSWTPSSMLPEGLQVLEAWGFSFKMIAFIWVKTTKLHPGEGPDDYETGKDDPGTGRYTTNGAEICLLGVRGKASPWHPKEGWRPRQVYRLPHQRWPEGTPPAVIPCPRCGAGPCPGRLADMQICDECGGAGSIKQRRSGQIIAARKPFEIRRDIDRWLRPHIGEGQFMELFATETEPGWVSLGHSMTGNDLRTDLTQYKEDLSHQSDMARLESALGSW